MTLNKIVSDVERVGKSPVGKPALRLCDLVAESVLRRFGRRLTQLYRAVDWDYARFALGYAATVGVLFYVTLERMR